MKDELIDKIKTRGYWRINFQPVDPSRVRTLEETKEVVGKSAVRLGKWNYPHFLRRHDDAGVNGQGNYCEGWIDWHSRKEFWRMYPNGHFLDYLGFAEDWSGHRWVHHHGTKLSVSKTLTQITAAYEFLIRLTALHVYDHGVHVTISLHDMSRRKLWFDDHSHKTGVHEALHFADTIQVSQQYSREQLRVRSSELSLPMTVQIFYRMGWNKIPIFNLKREQDKILSTHVKPLAA